MNRIALTLLVLVFASTSCIVHGAPVVPKNDEWDVVTEIFENFDRIRAGTIIVGSTDDGGMDYIYNKGDADEDTVHMSASATKLMTSTTVLRLVEEGLLSLNDTPGMYIPWWTTDPEDPRTNITLAQLLSFTSGFHLGFPTCNVNPLVEFEPCAIELYENPDSLMFPPGTTYYYDNMNMRFAGLMAVYRVGASTWQEVYNEYILSPLDINATYDWPSTSNPDLGGGLSISAAAYYKVLIGLWNRSLLPTTGVLQEADQSGDDVHYEHRPVGTSWDFHYGFGGWRECFKEEWDGECAQHISLSSLGANGFYPLIDRKGYYFVLGTTANGILDVTYDLLLEIRPLIEQALGISQ